MTIKSMVSLINEFILPLVGYSPVHSKVQGGWEKAASQRLKGSHSTPALYNYERLSERSRQWQKQQALS